MPTLINEAYGYNVTVEQYSKSITDIIIGIVQNFYKFNLDEIEDEDNYQHEYGGSDVYEETINHAISGSELTQQDNLPIEKLECEIVLNTFNEPNNSMYDLNKGQLIGSQTHITSNNIEQATLHLELAISLENAKQKQIDERTKQFIKKAIPHELTHLLELYNRKQKSTDPTSKEPTRDTVLYQLGNILQQDSIKSFAGNVELTDQVNYLGQLIYAAHEKEIRAKIPEIYEYIKEKNINSKEEFINEINKLDVVETIKHAESFDQNVFLGRLQVPQSFSKKYNDVDEERLKILYLKFIFEIIMSFGISAKLDKILPKKLFKNPNKLLKYYEHEFHKNAKLLKEKLLKLYSKYMEEKKNIQESNSNHKYEYGCLMVKVIFPKWDQIINQIPDDKIYDEHGFGKETEPHVTILFGFLHDQIKMDDLKSIIKSINNPNNFNIYVNGVSYFDNDEYDVLKFDVESEELRKLNSNAKHYPNEETYPEYNPHITIAYLKKGEGKKHTKKFNQPFIVKPNYFYYSSPDNQKIKFKTQENYERL